MVVGGYCEQSGNVGDIGGLVGDCSEIIFEIFSRPYSVRVSGGGVGGSMLESWHVCLYSSCIGISPSYLERVETMNEYLVQLQVKKPNGKVHLISLVREAASIEAAYREALGMSAGSGEIVGGYATGDPYKIGEWVCRNRLPADIVHMTVTD